MPPPKSIIERSPIRRWEEEGGGPSPRVEEWGGRAPRARAEDGAQDVEEGTPPAPSRRANGPPKVFDCKEDCRNPALGTCKLFVLVVGGIMMLPLFILPYLCGKCMVMSCRGYCRHVCVPCMEGVFSCLGAVYRGCLRPCCSGMYTSMGWVWNTLCVPVYAHVVYPTFIGVYNTLAWIWNSVIWPLSVFVYDGFAYIFNGIVVVGSFIWNRIFVPIGRGVSATCSCIYTSVLLPVLRGIRAVGVGIYDWVLQPTGRFIWNFLFVPVWNAMACVYRWVLLPFWQHAIVWPIQQVGACLEWVFGSCLPAIGRGIVSVWRAVVVTPLLWVWRNLLRPLLHYTIVVPYRAIVLPCARCVASVASAIASGVRAVMRAIGGFFAALGRALGGGGRQRR
jgi:hypothetical protein